MTTLTYSGTLTVEICWCGIRHAIPAELAKEAARAGTTVYCPVGHGWVIKDSENARLKRDLKWAEDRAAAALAERDQAEASRRAWKGQTTRLRKRVLEGECPICGQHLRDVQRHVARQHPTEQAEMPEPSA